ncbi:hypothetical protein PMIN06_012106 [Paraphaeosphaeria minitans]
MTTKNVWRHYVELCPEPDGVAIDSNATYGKYPVGWEERATVWSHHFDGCKFVIFLLDPLPLVRIKRETKRKTINIWQEKIIPKGNQWIIKEEGPYVRQRVHASRNRQPQQVFAWCEESSLGIHFGDPSPSTTLPPPRTDTIERSLPQTSGIDLDPKDAAFTSTALRRTTKAEMEQAQSDAVDISSTSPRNSTSRHQFRSFDIEPLVSQSSALPSNVLPPMIGPFPTSPVPAPGSPRTSLSLLSQKTDHEPVTAKEHVPFVPYVLVTSRSSSSARNDATFVTKHIHAYIESLQIPTSTLEEFEHFLQVPVKRKEDRDDPFRALLLAIHDDSDSLVNIIRVSLQRIREDTLDEDLIQRRVAFWRELLHRLSSNLDELDKSLRSFVHFMNGRETSAFHTVLPSEKIAEDTHLALRSCMDPIDKSSHSLLAELQIIHTRKSIAEAESVSKLTELTFVFIPLSLVASLFSMQINELKGGFPLYRVALVAIGFVVVAYAL